MEFGSRIANGVDAFRSAEGPMEYLTTGVWVAFRGLVGAGLAVATVLYVLFWLNVARLHVLDGGPASAAVSVAVAAVPPILLFSLLR